MSVGKVYLVGAGPGDTGLITIKGMECLKRADVIVYDRLIDDRLLRYARDDAELINVGKSSKSHTKEQQDINRALIDKATDGKVVVRLKGGDPFVLGRGGEESEALVDKGIPFEVVPGVSSATAVPAYAGIPVTHRDIGSSFVVVTGHEDPTKAAQSVRWDKLAEGADTLVCLMGMGNLDRIVAKLLECGKGPDTPVALIKEGTTSAQQTIVGTLETIAEKADRAGFKPPVVIVIGEVVSLRDKLNWFEQLPLFGKRVLVTRTRAQASTLSRLLVERGAEPIELPIIEIQEVADPAEMDRAITNLSDYRWVLFTSVNGVQAFWKRLHVLGLDARHFGSVKIGAIGPATADGLAQRGINPDVVPRKHTSEALVGELAAVGIDRQLVLLPRADIAPDDLNNRLKELGAEIHAVTAYNTRLPSQSLRRATETLADGNIDIVTFTSSSTVNNLISALDGDIDAVNETVIACIGPVTAAAAEDAGLKVGIVAQEYTIPGLVAAVERHLQERGGE